MKDIKMILDSVSNGNKVMDFNKITSDEVNKIMSFLANVPVQVGKEGLSARSYRAALGFESQAVVESTKDGITIRIKEIEYSIPNLVLLDSLGEPVYKEVEEGHKYTLAVPNLPLPSAVKHGIPFLVEYMPIDQLEAFVELSASKPASTFLAITGVQTANPRMSSVCPFVLLAHKLYRGVKYSEWARDHGEQGVLDNMLPKDLLGISALRVDFGEKTLRDYLEMMSHSSNQRVVPTGRNMLSLKTCASKMATKGLRDGSELSPQEASFQRIPMGLKRLLLQIWVFNAEFRTEDLILDINDWSNVPDNIWNGFIGFASPGKKKFMDSGGW